MENEVKYLTVKEVIDQLSKLSPDLHNREVVFSYPNGKSLGMVGIENITILKSTDDEDKEITMVSIGGAIEQEEQLCDCKDCRMDRGEDVEMTEDDIWSHIQGLYIAVAQSCGLKKWVGYKYFLEELKDQMEMQGFEEEQYKHLL